MSLASKKSRIYGFALPTVLIASIIMLSVLLSAVKVTSGVSSAIRTEYYNQLAKNAADSGVSYVKSCLESNQGVALWSSASPLRVNTDCSGIVQNNLDCSLDENVTDASCNVSLSSDGKIATSFSVSTASNSVSGWKTISMGAYHTCAIGYDNKAYCWGSNSNGQLGNGTLTDSSKPVPVKMSGVLANKTINSISVGNYHTCAVASDGLLYCWGSDSNGQLGDDSNLVDSNVPVAVDASGVLAGKKVNSVTLGYYHTCAIASDNLAYCWGLNTYGALGNNSNTQSAVPVAVNMTSGVSALYGKTLRLITSGDYFTCSLASDSLVYCWGNGGNGALGTNSTAWSAVPVAVNMTSGVSALYGKTVTAISAGPNHMCVVASDSLPYCWGFGTFGQLGNNTSVYSAVPVAVNMTSGVSALYGKTVVSLTSGSNSTCVLASDDLVYCWGYNAYYQLGDGSTTTRLVPVASPRYNSIATTGTKAIYSGGNSNCAIAGNSQLYCWGSNSGGRLGDGTTTDKTSIIQIDSTNIEGAVATNVTVTGTTKLISNSGKVWKTYSQTKTYTPTMKLWTKVSVGATHTCAIDISSQLYCWGLNSSGQLGNNTATNSSVPTAVYTAGVLAGKAIKDVSVGSSHTCALTYDGLIYCWGSNTYGKLGINSTVGYLAPVAVNTASGVSALYGKTVKSISVGGETTCAVANDNLAYCWGYGATGRLGNYDSVNKLVPVAVNMTSGLSALYGKTVLAISVGGNHACTVASDSLVYCWGSDAYGALGNNSTTSSSVPVAVNMATGVSALYGKTIQSKISTGPDLTCVVASDGLAYCWGNGAISGLGNNAQTMSTVPVAVNNTIGVSALYGKVVIDTSIAMSSACTVTADGGLYCWAASNTYGQIGNETTTASLVAIPTIRSGAMDGVQIADIESRVNHSCALSVNSRLYCWGLNNYGQLGNGTTTNALEPTLVLPPIDNSLSL